MNVGFIVRFAPVVFALGLCAALPAAAQTPPSPAPTVAATPAPTPAVPPKPSATAPADSTLLPPPGHATPPASEYIDLTAKPCVYIEAKANHDEVYAAIQGAIAQLRAEIAKANLKTSGHPLAVFLEADDTSFRYRAEIALDQSPAGITELSTTVKIGQTPAGKTMRFEHRGPYDEIDATYEAITAYLDEKGVDAQDVFVEEYLNDVKTADDPNLQVDIYVMLK